MKTAVVIGSGIAGMMCVVRLAEQGVKVALVSPFPSERSQSVMAAGGINAVLPDCEEGDSVSLHIEDTLKGGANLAGKNAVTGLCTGAADIIRYLEGIGTVFSTDKNGNLQRRAFGGQSKRRTCYCGSATGKQIVSALVMETRRFEAQGLITRKLWSCFHSALIKDNRCYGVLVFDEHTFGLEAIYADATVMSTGGQNALFGKTTGSTLCDGYAAGKLFMQGAVLKNLEFIQYHPTTFETAQKRMLISEAARGEGGRLFYTENGQRRYFLEEKYGKHGNLLTRDLLSREIHACEKQGREVFLDVTHIDRKTLEKKIPEVLELCRKFGNTDMAKEPIRISPSVHFFMGGLAVHNNHETSIENLFAVGECASIYHGANRLGGNSLLAACYGGRVAADEIAKREAEQVCPDFTETIEKEKEHLAKRQNTESSFPVMYVRGMLADTMNQNLGIVRCGEDLKNGIRDVEYCLSVAEKLNYDNSVLPYFNYSLTGILTLGRAVLTCAEFRKESRGAHFRSDFEKTDENQQYATLISYDGGRYIARYDTEGDYEN